jgi:hypothetical protein
VLLSGTPASSTTKTGRHDIAEILLKDGGNHQTFNKSHMFITISLQTGVELRNFSLNRLI